MNKNKKCPFEVAEIEIVKLIDCDVITASGFEGDDDGDFVGADYYGN